MKADTLFEYPLGKPLKANLPKEQEFDFTMYLEVIVPANSARQVVPAVCVLIEIYLAVGRYYMACLQ